MDLAELFVIKNPYLEIPLFIICLGLHFLMLRYFHRATKDKQLTWKETKAYLKERFWKRS